MLNCWSYRGVQITVGTMRKYSITLVFSSWSNYRHVSTKIAVSNCCLQWSQIWCRCQIFCFEVFLVIQGWRPITVFISMMWCLSYIHDCYFHKMGQSVDTNAYFSSPFNSDVSMQIFVSADSVTYSWISYYDWRFYPFLGQDFPHDGVHVFIWIPVENCQFCLPDLHLLWSCWFVIPKSYPPSSCENLGNLSLEWVLE
jgi:hypothetical protein